MKTLFLINTEEEYRAARNIIDKGEAEDPLILSYADTSPYFVDSFKEKKDISAWEDYLSEKIELSKYWLIHYREVERLIKREINNFPGEEVHSDNFMLKAVWNMGVEYYQAISLLVQLFDKHKPELVYFSSGPGFFRELVSEVARHLSVGIKGYGS